MNAKNFAASFFIIGAIVLVVSLIVTYIYGLIVHGSGVAEWESSIRLAIILGIVVPLVRHFEKGKA
jgi:hypothetical protein